MSSSFVPLIPACVASSISGKTPREAYALAAQVMVMGAPQADTTWCDADFNEGAFFLALTALWRTSEHRSTRLHIVALAERPLTRDTLRLCHEGWALTGEMAALSQDLVAQWPHVLPGQHRLTFFGGAVTLTLLAGPAHITVPRAGFYADGFVWQTPADDPAICRQRIALLSRHSTARAWWLVGARQPGARQPGARQPGARQPGARQPGAHQPDLEQAIRDSAFVIDVSYDGPVMVARRRDDKPVRHTHALTRSRAYQADSVTPGKRRDALVIGAGLAGAHVARALADRGWQVHVLARDTPHDGHMAAALTPVVARDDNPRARLTRAGALRARAVWRDIATDAVRACGTIQLDRAQGRAGELADTLSVLQFPPGWVRAIDAEEASRLSGLALARGGVFFAQGMLVQPDRLIAALLDHPGISLTQGVASRLLPTGAGWQVLSASGDRLGEGSQLVMATAADTPSLLACSGLLAPLPVVAQMHALAGEIVSMPTHPAYAPRCIVAGDGYLLPASDTQVVAGSTYRHGAVESRTSPEGKRAVLDKVAAMLAHGQEALPAPAQCGGWAGWRAVLPGRLPVVGALPHAQGVWLAAGYGSRGLTWSTLAGEIIAGALEGEPAVLDADLMRMIAPR